MSDLYTSNPDLIRSEKLRPHRKRSGGERGRMRLLVRGLIVFLALGILVLGVCGIAG